MLSMLQPVQKRQFTNPDVFNAYTLRSWEDITYISQELFDSFITAEPLGSVASVQDVCCKPKTTTRTPTEPETTPAPEPEPISTPTQTIDIQAVVATLESHTQQITELKTLVASLQTKVATLRKQGRNAST